jgi:hypothetical protein
MPLNGLVRSRPAIDEQSQPSGKNDVKSLNRVILAAQYVASIQVAQGSVGYQPRQLRSGRCSQGPMFSQPIDEVLGYHRLSLSKTKAEESLTRYQKGNGFVCAGRVGRHFLTQEWA